MAKRFSGRFLGIDYALLPNRQWNKKQKTQKKQPWSKVECFAFGGATVRFAIGNEFPCRLPHNPSATLLRGLSTLHQG